MYSEHSDHDGESLDSLSPKQQPQQSSTSCFHKLLLSFMSLLLILCVSIEMISFKSTATAFPFSACFIICLFYLCNSLSWFMICIYKLYIINKYNHIYPIIGLRKEYILLGILRSFSISIIFICISRDIPGSLLIILLQFPTPISIIMSRFISSISLRSISNAHWTAIILIFIGISFGFISSYFGHLGNNYIEYNNNNNNNTNKYNHINAWWYTPICIVSCLPQSIAILYKEIKKFEYNMSSNAWISLIQCIFTFLLSPILIYLGDYNTVLNNSLNLNDWYLFIHKGFLCLFTSSINGTIYCPNGNILSIIQFIIWLCTSIIVILLTNYININISPLISRFCVLFGLLFAFIFFQIGFPFVINNTYDKFDEFLLLGILCSFVGSIMLLIDFNPSRTNTLLDSIQFDELNHLKKTKSQLLMLKKQYKSLSLSQIDYIKEGNGCINDMNDMNNININNNENEENINTTDYVFYLLMEQQKDIIQEEYQTKLEEYNRIEKRQRSKSFHAEFYGQKQKRKKKRKKKKGNEKKYYMDEQQIKEYYMLLQQQHMEKMEYQHENHDIQ